MAPPGARRPHMPGYGIAPATEGTGLLPWSWAVEQIERSHDFWLATIRPDGRPHVMPVWGVWVSDSPVDAQPVASAGGALWFSSGLRSRKARNLAGDERATMTTDDAHHPVVVEGTVTRMVDRGEIATFAAAVDAKYGTDYGADFYDPEVNGSYRLTPTAAFGLDDEDFAGSPTWWTFG